MANKNIIPNGCRYCGIDKYGHGSRWSQNAEDAGHKEAWNAGYGRTIVTQDGRHKWVAPTQEQIKVRMLQRRQERNDAKILHGTR